MTARPLTTPTARGENRGLFTVFPASNGSSVRFKEPKKKGPLNEKRQWLTGVIDSLIAAACDS